MPFLSNLFSFLWPLVTTQTTSVPQPSPFYTPAHFCILFHLFNCLVCCNKAMTCVLDAMDPAALSLPWISVNLSCPSSNPASEAVYLGTHMNRMPDLGFNLCTLFDLICYLRTHCPALPCTASCFYFCFCFFPFPLAFPSPLPFANGHWVVLSIAILGRIRPSPPHLRVSVSEVDIDTLKCPSHVPIGRNATNAACDVDIKAHKYAKQGKQLRFKRVETVVYNHHLV